MKTLTIKFRKRKTFDIYSVYQLLFNDLKEQQIIDDFNEIIDRDTYEERINDDLEIELNFDDEDDIDDLLDHLEKYYEKLGVITFTF